VIPPSNPANPTTTRLAPSPTGALHLGNVRTFVVNYVLARQRGWRVLLRVEDLDGPRVKPQAADALIEELAWLGLEWDGPVVVQSRRQEAYRRALEQLKAAGHAYPCVCTRRDIEAAASAPHAGEHDLAYPGTCRPRFDDARDAGILPALCAPLTQAPEDVKPASPRRGQDARETRGRDALDTRGQDVRVTPDRPTAWRLRVDATPIVVRDHFAGEHTFDLARICGDFVIVKNDGTAAYQLAVTLDDAESGVDAVVRGDDLLDSAARQTHLRTLLGLEQNVHYWHLPLVIGPDGRRLAKRHGDTRLAHYRARGCPREKILGLMGFWTGQFPTRQPCSMNDLVKIFNITTMPRTQTVFSAEDDAFLG